MADGWVILRTCRLRPSVASVRSMRWGPFAETVGRIAVVTPVPPGQAAHWPGVCDSPESLPFCQWSSADDWAGLQPAPNKFGMIKFWVGKTVLQLAVIGQQKQPFTVTVHRPTG